MSEIIEYKLKIYKALLENIKIEILDIFFEKRFNMNDDFYKNEWYKRLNGKNCLINMDYETKNIFLQAFDKIINLQE